MLVVVVRVCGRRRRVRSSHVCTLSLAVSDVAFSLLVHTLMILAALGVDSALLFNTIGKRRGDPWVLAFCKGESSLERVFYLFLYIMPVF